MDLDYDPIYCVEQIQIPPSLPDILKGFAKEAIRSQPPCLHEFACTYFQRLLANAKLDASAPPPTLAQDTESMNPETLREICASHGIASAAFAKVFQLIEFPTDPVDPKEILVLLVTTTAKNFVAVIDAHVCPTLFQSALLYGEEGSGHISANCERPHQDFAWVIILVNLGSADQASVSFGDIRSNPHMQQYFNTK